MSDARHDTPISVVLLVSLGFAGIYQSGLAVCSNLPKSDQVAKAMQNILEIFLVPPPFQP